MKVVIIVPTLKSAGTERFVLRLLRELDKSHEFHLIVLSNEGGLLKEFESLSIGIFIMRLFHGGKLQLKSIVKELSAIRRIILSIQPDSIHSFLYPSDLITYILNLRRRYNLVWSIRGTDPSGDIRRTRKLLRELTFRLMNKVPNRIVACSSSAKVFAVSKGVHADKILVINNFLEPWTAVTSSNSQLVIDSPYPENRIKIGIATRFDPNKGLFELIEAVYLASLLTQKSFTLSFIGKGLDRLQNYVEQPKFVTSKKIVFDFQGEILDESRKAEWFSNIDLYVMSSRDLEGFPNSLAEAIAIGCPAIGTSAGNSQEMLAPSLVINSCTPQSIASKIVEILLMDKQDLVNEVNQSREKLTHITSKACILNAYNEVWLNRSALN